MGLSPASSAAQASATARLGVTAFPLVLLVPDTQSWYVAGATPSCCAASRTVSLMRFCHARSSSEVITTPRALAAHSRRAWPTNQSMWAMPLLERRSAALPMPVTVAGRSLAVVVRVNVRVSTPTSLR